MLKETYFDQRKGWGVNPYLNNGVPEIVMRNVNHVLSPSLELLNDYKKKRITWSAFVLKYHYEMDNDRCKKEMLRIKKLAEEKDVYLICACHNKEKHCHRYVLLELINAINL